MTFAPSIETVRLRLRRWCDSDLKPFAVMNADSRVMAHFPSTLSAAESNALAERIAKHFDMHNFGLWAVELKENRDFAGFVGLSIPMFEAHFTPCVEIGWRLAANYWGHGYATEGAFAVMKYAFEVVKLDEIVSMTSVHNHRSRRIMERLGMTHSPADDFNHPNLPLRHSLSRHVLYRKTRRSH